MSEKSKSDYDFAALRSFMLAALGPVMRILACDQRSFDVQDVKKAVFQRVEARFFFVSLALRSLTLLTIV